MWSKDSYLKQIPHFNSELIKRFTEKVRNNNKHKSFLRVNTRGRKKYLEFVSPDKRIGDKKSLLKRGVLLTRYNRLRVFFVFNNF